MPHGFALLAEGEGTLRDRRHYNAFPFAIVDSQRRPQFSVVADPENIELNRLQLQYKSKPQRVTLGRQRINLDDQRWVGSVGWRQNEQTFDARARRGRSSGRWRSTRPIRTASGRSSASRPGPRQVAYRRRLRLRRRGREARAGQAEGLRLSARLRRAVLPRHQLADLWPARSRRRCRSAKVKLNLAGSYARQSDYGGNPDRLFGRLHRRRSGRWRSSGLTADRRLGTARQRQRPRGAPRLQTPLATLHKFNGWADMFLTTPQHGPAGSLRRSAPTSSTG